LIVKKTIEIVPRTNQYWVMRVVYCSRKQRESLMKLELRQASTDYYTYHAI